jgi:hypothetical protein
VNGIRQHQGVASHNAVATLFNVELVHAFRLLNNWCQETRMRFGQDKTQWVVFDKTLGPFATKDFSRYRQYRLCGFSPQVVEEYKYLGVTHHRQLYLSIEFSPATTQTAHHRKIPSPQQHRNPIALRHTDQ